MLYTGLVGHAETIHGTPLNITARHKSIWAPPWSLIRAVQPPAVRRAELTVAHPAWVRYATIYRSQLRLLWLRDRSLFTDLVEMAAAQDVTLCCFCAWATHHNPVCHRFLLHAALCAVAERMDMLIDPLAPPEVAGACRLGDDDPGT
jgi:hypothetical protein